MPGPRLTRKRPRNFTRPGRTCPAPTGRRLYAVCTFDVPAGVFLSARGDVSAVISELGDAGFCGAVHCVCGLCRPRRAPHRRQRDAALGRMLDGAGRVVPAVRLPAGAAGNLAVDGMASVRRLVCAGTVRDAGAGAERQPGPAGCAGRVCPPAVRKFLPAGAHGLCCAAHPPAGPHGGTKNSAPHRYRSGDDGAVRCGMGSAGSSRCQLCRAGAAGVRLVGQTAEQ